MQKNIKIIFYNKIKKFYHSNYYVNIVQDSNKYEEKNNKNKIQKY